MASSLQRFQELSTLADAQAGYFTAGQAYKLGYSYSAQHHHVKQGTWQRTRHGLFRLNTYPISQYEHLVELSLWSRNREGKTQAVVSHHTALAFYEMSDLLPQEIHLSVPKGFRKVAPAGVILHVNNVPPNEQHAEHGFQITTPLRTLRDMVNSDLTPELLEQAMMQAVEQGLVNLNQISPVSQGKK